MSKYDAEWLQSQAIAIERMHGETLTVEWRVEIAKALRDTANAIREREAALEAVTLERDAAQMELKRHFPISKYDGLDIEQWMARAKACEEDAARYRWLLVARAGALADLLKLRLWRADGKDHSAAIDEARRG